MSGKNLIGAGIGIGVGIEEEKTMAFGHEQLDVYRAAIKYVGWAYLLCERLKGHRNAKDQLLRASQSIPLNIAEGNGKATDGDRRKYFEIARGSALECGAIQDVLEVCDALSPDENAGAKQLLDRIVAMLTKLGHRGYSVQDDTAKYGAEKSDTDADTDIDSLRKLKKRRSTGGSTRQHTCSA
jgi:four helix bundle protein